MKEIKIIKASTDSPRAMIDFQNGIIEISGKSLMENAYEFYGPILSDVIDCLNENTTGIKVMIQAEYLNSSSLRYLMELFMIIKKSNKPNSIVWLYEKGDDIIKEKGQQLEAILALNFEIKEADTSSSEIS